MGITLYYFALSPPARCALLVAKALGLDVEVKHVNLGEDEHKKPEYLKINPQHLVPTLVDGDLAIGESGAIAAYLVNAYGKNDSLYPKDPKKRAIVDSRLHFSNGTLFAKLKALCAPIAFAGEKEINPVHKKEYEDALQLINIYLERQDFVAGNNLTIADISLVTVVSSFIPFGWDMSQFENVNVWLKRCEKTIPGYKEINQTGVDAFCSIMKGLLGV